LRPAVIIRAVDKKDIALDLFLKYLISEEEYGKIRALLVRDYTIKKIGDTKYYIRNDKL
jgi:hypothetical protein